LLPAFKKESGGEEGMMTNYKMLNMESYERKMHFDYFRTLGYPYVGVTVMIDITHFYKKVKQNEMPFFLSFLYLAAKAANDVPELRRRIRGDEIAEYDLCMTSHTVMKEDGTFSYCQLDCGQDFETFLPDAQQKQDLARNCGDIEDDPQKVESYFFVSCIPWLSYTSLIQATPIPADSNPRISWGKYTEEGGKITMPVSLLAHHGLVDGMHLGQFFEGLQKMVNEW